MNEIWLSQSVYEEITVARFSVLQKDQEVHRGIGCAVYVANGLKIRRRVDYMDDVARPSEVGGGGGVWGVLSPPPPNNLHSCVKKQPNDLEKCKNKGRKGRL